MKRKILSLTCIMLISITTILLFVKSQIIKNAIIMGFKLWFYYLVPSLIPFFVVTNILSELGIVTIISNLFNNLTQKIFKTPGIASFIFLMSFLTGSPGNAKYVKDALDKKLLTNNEAIKILSCTLFINPIFILNSAITLFHNPKLGFMLIITQLLSNLITALIIRHKWPTKITPHKNSFTYDLKQVHHNINNKNIFNIITSSFSNAITTLVSVLTMIIMCSIILAMITSLLPLSPLSNTLVSGFIEITNGIKKVDDLSLTIYHKLLICSCFISFGSLSIHAQIMNILNQYHLNYRFFFMIRLLNIAISLIIIPLWLQF